MTSFVLMSKLKEMDVIDGDMQVFGWDCLESSNSLEHVWCLRWKLDIEMMVVTRFLLRILAKVGAM